MAKKKKERRERKKDGEKKRRGERVLRGEGVGNCGVLGHLADLYRNVAQFPSYAPEAHKMGIL